MHDFRLLGTLNLVAAKLCEDRPEQDPDVVRDLLTQPLNEVPLNELPRHIEILGKMLKDVVAHPRLRPGERSQFKNALAARRIQLKRRLQAGLAGGQPSTGHTKGGLQASLAPQGKLAAYLTARGVQINTSGPLDEQLQVVKQALAAVRADKTLGASQKQAWVNQLAGASMALKRVMARAAGGSGVSGGHQRAR